MWIKYMMYAIGLITISHCALILYKEKEDKLQTLDNIVMVYVICITILLMFIVSI